MLPDGTDVAQERKLVAPVKGSEPPPTAYKKAARQNSPKRRHVGFNPLTNVLILFSPTSSPMEAPHSFYVFSEPNREYFDIPAYRGERVAGENKRKACLLNDKEGGWVMVNRSDFDGAPAPAKSVADASTQTESQESYLIVILVYYQWSSYY